ncbi:MAG: AraC family transcriptional regulator [Ruminococcaceae bacterium]|nr:AraC family transcriptional regulator [Oscillospiraceae bacterium]
MSINVRVLLIFYYLNIISFTTLSEYSCLPPKGRFGAPISLEIFASSSKEVSCYLMKNTNLSVAQCAFDSGFSSLRSFNRSFKENLNITPTKYKNSNE